MSKQKLLKVVDALMCCGYSKDRAVEIAAQDLNYKTGEDEITYSQVEEIYQGQTVPPGAGENGGWWF